MSEEQLKMLTELMEVGFCLIEMSMFLDTHPNDERGVALHNAYAAKYKELTDTYNLKFEALTSNDFSETPWEFINDPWPWDTDYINKCM